MCCSRVNDFDRVSGLKGWIGISWVSLGRTLTRTTADLKVLLQTSSVLLDKASVADSDPTCEIKACSFVD